MNIEANRINQNFLIEVISHRGTVIRIDAGKKTGGDELGASPMELLLSAIAGCSSIDVLYAAKKKNQSIEDFKVIVEGIQRKGIPAPFEKIHLHFQFTGKNLNQDILNKAVERSFLKYGTVATQLRPSAVLTYSTEFM